MIKYLSAKFSELGSMPMTFFKVGEGIVISALCGVCALCYEDSKRGSIGTEIYYAPMLEYILTSFIIIWGGTLLLDIAQKEMSARK